MKMNRMGDRQNKLTQLLRLAQYLEEGVLDEKALNINVHLGVLIDGLHSNAENRNGYSTCGFGAHIQCRHRRRERTVQGNLLCYP